MLYVNINIYIYVMLPKDRLLSSSRASSCRGQGVSCPGRCCCSSLLFSSAGLLIGSQGRSSPLSYTLPLNLFVPKGSMYLYSRYLSLKGVPI